MLPVLIPPPRTQPSSYTSRMSPRQALLPYHTVDYTSSQPDSQPDNCQPVPASSPDTQAGCTQTINCPGHSGRQPRSPLPGSLGPGPKPKTKPKGTCSCRRMPPQMQQLQPAQCGFVPDDWPWDHSFISSRPFPHAACDSHLVQILKESERATHTPCAIQRDA